MTHSYFHHLSALILMHSTRKEGSLERLERWICQVDEAFPPVLCVLTNVVDPSDPDEHRVIERVTHFLSHKSIDPRLCFNICARTGKEEGEGLTAVVDACNKLLDRLIQKQLEESAGSFDIISASLKFQPMGGVSMVKRRSEVGTSRVNLLQPGCSAEDDAGDNAGRPVQDRARHHRCQKC